MNLTTYNALVMNSNPLDLYGRRTAGLGTINNQKDFNSLMAGDNLTQIKVYDNSYLDDTFTPITFIPDGVVVLVGKRPGNQAVGNYLMVRNASNPSFAPGAPTCESPTRPIRAWLRCRVRSASTTVTRVA